MVPPEARKRSPRPEARMSTQGRPLKSVSMRNSSAANERLGAGTMQAMSSISTSIADLRKSYERAELSESASLADPLQQFDQWLQEALSAQVPEPNAMTLATVGGDLRPSTRIVLIKGYDERGLVWYTNYDSRKGQQLAGNPFAALQFHWRSEEHTSELQSPCNLVCRLLLEKKKNNVPR